MLPERPDRPCPGRRHGRSARPAGGRSSPVETACGRARPVLRSSLPSPRSSLLRPRAGQPSLPGFRQAQSPASALPRAGEPVETNPAVEPVETPGRSSPSRPWGAQACPDQSGGRACRDPRRPSMSRPPGGPTHHCRDFDKLNRLQPRTPAADFDKLNRRQLRTRRRTSTSSIAGGAASPAVEPVETPGRSSLPRPVRRSSPSRPRERISRTESSGARGLPGGRPRPGRT